MRPSPRLTHVHRVKPALSPAGLCAGLILSLIGLVVFWIPVGAALWWLLS